MIIVIKIKVMKNYVDSKKAKYRDGAPYGDAGIKRKQNKTFIKTSLYIHAHVCK